MSIITWCKEVLHRVNYCMGKNFKGENFAVLWLFVKFSPQNLGVWCPLARHEQAIPKSFLHENYISTNSRKFFPLKVSRYMVCSRSKA